MGSIDKFLNQIEKKYQNKQQEINTLKNSISGHHQKVNNKENNDHIDSFLSEVQISKQYQKSQEKNQDLLSDIEVKFQQQKSTSPKKSDSQHDLLLDMEEKFQQQKSTPSKQSDFQQDSLMDIEAKFQQQKSTQKSGRPSSVGGISLENIAENFMQKQAEIKQHQKTDNLEDIRRQELEKQKREKQLIRTAERWLKNLDPYSDEGFWFEQFALSYPSKLEAAIDYLRALQ